MKTYWIYIFESGYRTGACRLTAKELRSIEKTEGPLMRKIEA